MKKTRKIIPALVMLVISAVLLSTASYAWFATSATVTAKNMKVKATVPSSLFIRATDTADWAFEANLTDENSDVEKLVPVTTDENFSKWYTTTAGSTSEYQQGGVATEVSDIKDTASVVGYADNTGYAKVYTCEIYSSADMKDFAVQNFGASLFSDNDFGKALRIGVHITEKVSSSTNAYWIFNHWNSVQEIDSINNGASSDPTDLETGYSTTQTTVETNFDLAENVVYSVTVYIWYEGNDPDCTTTKGVAYLLENGVETVEIAFGQGTTTTD